jgi:tellurite methyltransferase
MPDSGSLDTAHERWDTTWGDAEARAAWSEPERAVVATVPDLQERQVRRVLDLGTGIGRHALLFARAGFEVVAVDQSISGLDQLAMAAAGEGLAIEQRQALLTNLPLESASVDHVLAWNVLYHGDTALVRAAFRECRRVLRDPGTFHLTMLSKRHRAYGRGTEIRKDTFVDTSSAGDKDHPHLYVDGATLAGHLRDTGFELRSMSDVDQHPPGQWHWAAVAETVTTTARP